MHQLSIALDGNGHLFVSGTSRDSSGWNDYATIAYSIVNLSPIPLGIKKVNGEVVLSWTNAGFGLQSAPTVTGAFINIAGATSPYTNRIAASQQYFRLISN